MTGETKNIIVVAADREELESYGRYLNAKGFNALLFGNEDSAVEHAVKGHPIIVITDISSASFSKSHHLIDGEKIFNSIKNNPNTKNVPFIFLADDVLNIKGFRKEIDTLFIKPVNMDELFARVRQCLLKGAHVIDDKQLSGRLSHISLPDILQVLHMNRKEGILSIVSDDKKGLIYIKDGEILNASVGSIEKEKALFRLLTLKDGRFEFLPRSIDIPPRIQGLFDNLLMEGMRQYDEFEKYKDSFAKSDVLLKTTVDMSILPKGLKPVIYEVLYLIEFYPRVGDIVEHSSFPDYEVYQTIADLIKKDCIEETKMDTVETRGAQHELISLSQSLEIKERIASDFGGILILYSDNVKGASFIDSLKGLPRFTINRDFATNEDYRKNPLGEVGSFKIYGGVEIALLAVPFNRNMLPLIKLFSGDAIGTVILFNGNDLKSAGESISHLPVKMPKVYVSSLGSRMDEQKKELGIDRTTEVFEFNEGKKDVLPIFHSLFGHFKEGIK